ncbi:MAG: hypothetical protein LBI64_06335 [Coriobacteriales bacterium]|jgi:uroporphyrinogen-III decarboxylase|nr:hypothetical protein [Coriobacteriales bacterium]
MLNERENFMELMTGGTPDHLVTQWSPFVPIMIDPLQRYTRGNRKKGTTSIDRWGTTISWPDDQPAAIPLNEGDLKVVKDVTRWREYVKTPDLEGAAAVPGAWDDARAAMDKLDRKAEMTMCFMGTGIFEQLHFLMGFEDALVDLLMEQEAIDELIEEIFQYRYTYARLLIENLKPDVICSHDDWGAKHQLFMHPDIWRRFFKERYRKFYQLFRDNGVISLHHADSHCEEIVEDMAEIGIDIWQGVLPQNNIPAMQKQLAGKMILMGGIDQGLVDIDGIDPQIIRDEVDRTCRDYVPGGSFIPCLCSGLRNGAIYPFVDEVIDDQIRKNSPLYCEY